MEETFTLPQEGPPDINLIARHMDVVTVEGTQITGYLHYPEKESIAALQKLFKEYGAVGFFRREGDGHVVTYAYLPPQKPARVWVNVVLLLATLGTTLLVGAWQRGANPLVRPSDLWLGLPFSVGIILILGGHELAHYLVARQLGVDATLPYFLPIPHPFTGTMGAFIRMRSPVPSRSALVRVGIAGPLAGFAVAIPVSAIGLALSEQVVVGGRSLLRLGSPLAFEMISRLVHGAPVPGVDVMLHPLAFAGWLGMFVTALNLLPAGQLDGGHIAYGVLGRHYRTFRWFVLGAMGLMGIFWPGWLFWGLLVVLFGLRHPPPLDDVTRLDRNDRLLVLAAALLLALTLTPVPFPAGGL